MNIEHYSHIDKKPSRVLPAAIAIIALLGYGCAVFAAAPSGGYAPGATLDPSCAPGTTDCVVTIPSGGSSASTWGAITGTIANQTDLQTALNGKWSLTGNAGTTPGTNFIGTTDAQDLVFKTNGVQDARMFNADGSFLIGPEISLTYSGSGEKTESYFDPTVQAIRLGSVLGTEWDPGSANVGNRSIAIGFANSIASAPASIASGQNSIAIGTASTASGFASIALGSNSTASNISSLALGNFALASGQNGNAIGLYATASGYSATAIGYHTLASGDYSTAYGSYTTASGENTVASGLSTTAYSANESVFGSFNTAYTPIGTTTSSSRDRLFVVGNGDGSSSGHQHDALDILKNGNVAIGIDHWEADSDASTVRFKVSSTNSTVARFVDTSTGTSCDVIPSAGGSVLCSSDETLKQNIQPLDVSSSLAGINELKPVTYNWKQGSTQTVTGFIAQDIQQVFPSLVIQNSDGKLAVSYSGLIPYTVAAIQELDLNLSQIQNIADMSKPSSFRDTLVSWLGDASNGIHDLFADTVHTNNLCVGTTCVTEQQFLQMVQASSQGSGTVTVSNPVIISNDPAAPTDDGTQTPSVPDPTITPPTDSSSDTSSVAPSDSSTDATSSADPSASAQ